MIKTAAGQIYKLAKKLCGDYAVDFTFGFYLTANVERAANGWFDVVKMLFG